MLRFGFIAIVIALVTFTPMAANADTGSPIPQECGNGNYTRMVKVDSTPKFVEALANLKPGDLVLLQPGTYRTRFAIEKFKGSSSQMTYICGQGDVSLRPDEKYKGYGLHVDHSTYLHISHLDIRQYEKGVVLDYSHHIEMHDLTVREIFHEGVHFRNNTHHSLLKGSRISDTGVDPKYPQFGEGVYVGSSVDKWKNHKTPDRSDHNAILNNHISNTTAESVDIKEGTKHTLVANNFLDGKGMSPINKRNKYADSLIDVKGSDAIISNNRGSLRYLKGERLQENAFEVHRMKKNSKEIADSGERNRFVNNEVFGIRGGDREPGFIVRIATDESLNNVVECNNESNMSAVNTSNIHCTRSVEKDNPNEIMAGTPAISIVDAVIEALASIHDAVDAIARSLAGIVLKNVASTTGQ